MDLKQLLLLSVFLHSGLYVVSAANDWSYSGEHGPEHWPGLCMTGEKQSPINIATEEATKLDLGTFTFIRYDFAYPGSITNNGHSVQIQLLGGPIQLKGGNLSSTYTLEQMHFHWPAEHTVDDKRDALELHFVHYNSQYNNASEASQHENGIAVVSTLFEYGDEDNADMIPILKGSELVSKWVGKSTATMKWKVNPYLFLPKDHTTYYRYYGSLTTPGCQESVIWSIFTEKVSISEQQVSVFKNIGTSNGILNFNHRPVQELGERELYHHLNGYSTATSCASSLLYTLFSFMLIKLLHVT